MNLPMYELVSAKRKIGDSKVEVYSYSCAKNYLQKMNLSAKKIGAEMGPKLDQSEAHFGECNITFSRLKLERNRRALKMILQSSSLENDSNTKRN